MISILSIPKRFGRTLALALCAGFLLAAAGQAQQSAKAPANAKPPKRARLQPGKLDKGVSGVSALASPLSCSDLLVVITDASAPSISVGANVVCNHGYYVTTVPIRSSSLPIVVLLEQSAVYGPDCTITVSKGGSTAVLAVQQNYCALEAGTITATVQSGNATATGSAGGSYADSYPGIAWFTMN
jgi:hypothetical protein